MKTVMQMFNLPDDFKKAGDVGIEVEMEGINLPDAPMGWRRDDDGSLKGAENAEYVMRKPVPADQLRPLLERLTKALNRNEAEVVDTVRAGIHVHINVQELNELEVFNYATLYMIFEPLLIKYCGKGREGNLFCLRVQDAPWIVTALQVAAMRRRYLQLIDDNLRYSSMNVKALGQYGSLEFRAMRSTTDVDRIVNWADLLLRLREASKKFTDPKDIINSMSVDGVGAFIHKVFGDKAEFVMDLHPDAANLMKAGMRYAQDLAFCTDWNKFREEEQEEPKVFKGYKAHRVIFDEMIDPPVPPIGEMGEPGVRGPRGPIGPAGHDDWQEVAAWNEEW